MGTGKDGRVYHVLNPKEKSPVKALTEAEEAAKTKKLLSMKWDHIGLNQTNYSSTFDVYKQRQSSSKSNSRPLSNRFFNSNRAPNNENNINFTD